LDNPDWDNPEERLLCYEINEKSTAGKGDISLFIMYNSDWRVQKVNLPVLNEGRRWYRVIDTELKSQLDFADAGHEIPVDPPDHYLANPRSVVVLAGV
jgi:glycogen operon protein